MAFYNNWKTGKYFEWCTEVPDDKQFQSSISQTFLIQNVECYFALQRNLNSYDLYIQPAKDTSRSLKPKPFWLTILANFKRTKVLVKSWELYLFPIEKSQISDRSSNSDNGYLIRFFFMFPNEDELLPLEKKIESEDKSLQTGLYLNASVNMEGLPEDFSKLLETGSNHDAEVICGEHSMKAHKLVLSARSEVFKAMLESDMHEGRFGILEIKDIDVNYFQHFMEYLYTDVMPELNFDKAKAFYKVGDKYAVRSLILRCSDYLQDNLRPENIFECFVLADAHSDQKLKDKVRNFILDKKIYRESENWAPFCENFPKVAVEIYRLSYEENRKE